jgi:hypothetical protein
MKVWGISSKPLSQQFNVINAKLVWYGAPVYGVLPKHTHCMHYIRVHSSWSREYSRAESTRAVKLASSVHILDFLIEWSKQESFLGQQTTPVDKAVIPHVLPIIIMLKILEEKRALQPPSLRTSAALWDLNASCHSLTFFPILFVSFSFLGLLIMFYLLVKTSTQYEILSNLLYYVFYFYALPTLPLPNQEVIEKWVRSK